MKGSPRFFCDNCGSEVPFNEKRCPRCGRYFASIRCPKCGFAGEDHLFRKGCPVCGYSAPGEGKTKGKGAPPKAGTLPLWVYFLTITALLALFALFYGYLM